ncbi:hypothetical protein HK097_002550, partial [Rhizophlyctis rosea]
MAATIYEEAVAALSVPGAERTRAVRFIKNSIIGNRTKKELYLSLGVAPRLVEFVADPSCDVDLQVQTAVVLGSFTYGRVSTLPSVSDAGITLMPRPLAIGNEEQISAIIAAGAIPRLLHSLRSPDHRLVEASARALKGLLHGSNSPRHDMLQPDTLANFVHLLSIPETAPTLPKPSSQDRVASIRIAEVVAIILAKIAVAPEDQLLITRAGAIPPLVRLLDVRWSSYSKVQEASVEALAGLARDNAEVSQAIVDATTDDGQSATSQFFRLIRDTKPTTRLIVSACISNLYRTGMLPPGYNEDVALVVLRTLIRLFSEPPSFAKDSDPGWVEAQEKAPRIFAELVEHSEELQKAAMEGDAIHKLAGLLLGGQGAEE